MRSDIELKQMLGVVLQNIVRKSFLKRGFDDSFTEEEMIKIREIDSFLRAVSLHKDNPMFEDKQIKYICLSLCSSYKRKNGATVSVFYNKFVNQKDFEYEKIPYYIAKCIYKLIRNRHIEVFFAVNSFKASCIKEKVYIPERKGENVISSRCLFTDIDLPSELVSLSNEEILSLLRSDYQELFANLEPSYIVRSGGGVHLYYQLNESYYLKTQEQRTFYIEALCALQLLFEDYGADCRCVDITRILRVPYSRNRKPKYGSSDGKEVSILYKSDSTYDMFELNDKLRFLISGGMSGVYQSVLDDIFYDYEEMEQEVTDRAEETDEFEALEVSVDTLEEIPKERKTTATVKRLIDYGYKGIQSYYNYNGETYFQNKDMMIWLQNRTCHEGVRDTMIWLFNYNWYLFCGVKDFETMIERSYKLNTFFQPSLSNDEVERTVKHNFASLESKKRWKSICNTTIQKYLHFTEDERKHCCIGLYCDSYIEYQKALAQKKRRLSNEQYQKESEISGTTRQTEWKVLGKRLLQENTLMGYQEFKQHTGLSKSSFERYKKELGNNREKHYQEQREYYLQPFKSNPNISCSEYMQKLNCSRSTYNKYKKIYRDLNI